MRILHVSDLHFRRDWYDWVAGQTPQYDTVVISGDLLCLFPSHRTRIGAQIKWVLAWLKTFPGRLYLCSGNHDWLPTGNNLGYPKHALDGRWLRDCKRPGLFVDRDTDTFGGYRVTCCGWLEVPWDLPRDLPAIVVAHAPPAGTPTAVSQGDVFTLQAASLA